MMDLPLSIFPKINASLNAVSFCLMWIGFYFIKMKKTSLHIMFMTMALCVSTVFLISYVYYHFRVGEPTHFRGMGTIRYIYFTILISHTLLAMIVTPCLVVVVTKALRRDFESHKKWVRWVFPIWVYVSATGVVIFYFLYCLYP